MNNGCRGHYCFSYFVPRPITATSSHTGQYITPQILYMIASTLRDEYCIRPSLSLFSSHGKNWFAARCEYLHLIKKNSHRANRHCEMQALAASCEPIFAMTGKEALDIEVPSNLMCRI